VEYEEDTPSRLTLDDFSAPSILLAQSRLDLAYTHSEQQKLQKGWKGDFSDFGQEKS